MITEIKKYTYWKFSLIAIAGLFFVFLLNVGYVESSGKERTIFEMLFMKNKIFSELEIVPDITAFSLWSSGVSAYNSLVFSLFTGLGFSISVYYDKQGGRKYTLIRQNKTRYCINKIIGAAIAGGLLFMFAYAIFGLVVFLIYRDFGIQVFIFSQCFFLVVQRLILSFVYGISVTTFTVVVTVFFDDKYELICIPILLKYMVQIIETRLVLYGMNIGSEKCIRYAETHLSPENIISLYSSIQEKIRSIIVMVVFYIILIFSMKMHLEREEKHGTL